MQTGFYKSKIGQTVAASFRVLICVFLFFHLTGCFYFFFRRVFSFAIGIPLSLLFACAALFGVGLLLKKSRAAKERYRHGSITGKDRFILIFVVPLVIRVALLFLFHGEEAGDIYHYINISRELVKTGVVISDAEYSWSFPHLFWYGVFLSPASLIGNSYRAVGFYIAALYSAAGLCIYHAVKNFSDGDERIALISSCCFSYLPSQLFIAFAPTHEAGFTVILAIYLLCLSEFPRLKSRLLRIVIWLICCALLAWLKAVNSMGLVVIIATVIWLVFVVEWQNTAISVRLFSKTAMLALLLTSVVLLGRAGAFFQATHTAIEAEPVEKPWQWALFVGSIYETEGRLNEITGEQAETALAETAESEQITVNERNELLFRRALENWKDLSGTPSKLLKHVVNKFVNVWSGTHYTIEYTYRMNSGIRAYGLLGLVLMNNAIYILLISLTWLNMRQINSAAKEPAYICLLEIILCGGVAVLLLTEVMNKYNLTMLVPTLLISAYHISGTELSEEVNTKNPVAEK